MIKKFFKRILKPLTFDENVQSYAYPILKMIICGLLAVILVYRGNFLPNLAFAWNVLITIISLIIGVLSILCFEISMCEILALYDRKDKDKRKTKPAPASAMCVTTERIVSLAKNNDIIEFCILVNDQYIYLGASADSKPGRSTFFDKYYYVDDKELLTLEEFTQLLIDLSADGTLCVTEIDGTKPQHYLQL